MVPLRSRITRADDAPCVVGSAACVGRYRLARLTAEYGPDTKLPDLRHRLAKCPRHRPVAKAIPAV
jgi:hypothetical protein